jgi:hypothetical protein
MKQKDIVYLLLAVVILLVAGYIGYTQLIPKKTSSSSTVEVEKIGVIPSQLDAAGLASLSDTARARDFSSPVDFGGLGNKAPFGP